MDDVELLHIDALLGKFVKELANLRRVKFHDVRKALSVQVPAHLSMAEELVGRKVPCITPPELGNGVAVWRRNDWSMPTWQRSWESISR
jgi:hypothetical protein